MLCDCFSFALQLVLTNCVDDRGVRIDTELVQQAIACDLLLSDTMTTKAYALTGLENPNSVSQLKTWLDERGIQMDTLGKKNVTEMISELDKNGVDAEAMDMLKLRLQMAKSSVKKYQAAERCVCPDGRARGLFQFYGASRTGRYSGRNIQLQNLPQNHISTLDEARALVKMGCFDMVESIYTRLREKGQQAAMPKVTSDESRKTHLNAITWKYDWIQQNKKKCFRFAEAVYERQVKGETSQSRFIEAFIQHAANLPEPNRRLLDEMYELAWYDIQLYPCSLEGKRLVKPWYDTKESGDGKC